MSLKELLKLLKKKNDANVFVRLLKIKKIKIFRKRLKHIVAETI